MGHALHLRCFIEPGVDQSKVEATQLAYVSVIDLPFRLLLGEYFRFAIGDEGVFEVAGLNRFPLPAGKTYRVDDLPLKSEGHLVNTRVAVVEQPFLVDAAGLKLLRESQFLPTTSEAATLLSSDPGPQTLIFPQSGKHTKVLRRFVELYYIHCPPRFHGHDLRPIWEDEFLDRHVVFTGCLTKPGGRVPNGFLKALLRSENPRQNEVDMGAHALQDEPRAARIRFARALRTETPTLADRLWMLADSYAGHQNQEMAVITAVAALEAAVNLFARSRLEPILGSSLTGQLFREQGMHALIQALPKLQFPSHAQPSEETTSLVLNAITARNALMHGLHDKGGNPTFFNKGNLAPAIRACRDMMRCFEAQTGPMRRKRVVKIAKPSVKGAEGTAYKGS